jgi:hypothetical protein
MDFESFFVKTSPHILKVLINKVVDHLKSLMSLLGIDFFSSPPSVLFDPKRREGLLDLVVVANRTGNTSRRLLFFKGSTIIEPTLKLVSI